MSNSDLTGFKEVCQTVTLQGSKKYVKLCSKKSFWPSEYHVKEKTFDR